MPGRLSKIRQVFMNRRLAGLEKFLFLCFLLTCAALFAQDRFITTRQVIKPGGDYAVSLGDDRHKGGTSTAEWIDQDEFEWRCTLRDRFDYPYCFMQIKMDGADLTRYREMRMELEYSGKGSDSVQLTLLNHTPLYEQKPGSEFLKYNSVSLPVERLDQPVVINMDDFDVPDWWVSEFNVVPENAHTEIDEVMFIEIVTGGSARPGPYRFKLHSIELEGNLVSREHWYLGIIITWLVLLFATLVYRVFRLKSELVEHFAREQSLEQLTKTLDIKSRHYEKMARSDPLTGVNNRAGIGDFLLREIPSHRQSGNPLTFILLDIDHFKQINDTRGHQYGDEVLVAIARELSDNLRNSDGVARWGGEEFLLVCPNTSQENGRALAEKLRRRIGELYRDSDHGVTASFGVATMGKESIEDLMQRVDAALYRAKRNGRNRVEIAEP